MQLFCQLHNDKRYAEVCTRIAQCNNRKNQPRSAWILRCPPVRRHAFGYNQRRRYYESVGRPGYIHAVLVAVYACRRIDSNVRNFLENGSHRAFDGAFDACDNYDYRKNSHAAVPEKSGLSRRNERQGGGKLFRSFGNTGVQRRRKNDGGLRAKQ